jgi:ATP-binding cassette subfamily B protein
MSDTTIRRFARLLKSAGPGLVGVMVLVNLTVGLLLVGFVVVTSRLLGEVPAALDGGPGSPS